MPYPKKDKCIRGHIRTPENTYIDVRGVRVCRECKSFWANEHYVKVENPRSNQNDQKTHCVRGHEFTEENTRWKVESRTCKECSTEDQRKRQRERKGWSEEAFKKAVEEQEGKCAICFVPLYFGKEYKNSRACADHNHETGKARGVLCDRCNSGIGHLKDDLNIVKSAAAYLERYGKGKA